MTTAQIEPPIAVSLVFLSRWMKSFCSYITDWAWKEGESTSVSLLLFFCFLSLFFPNPFSPLMNSIWVFAISVHRGLKRVEEANIDMAAFCLLLSMTSRLPHGILLHA